MVRYPGVLYPVTVITGALLLLLCGIRGLLALISPAASARSKPSLGLAFPRAKACKGCHERVFEEWEASPYFLETVEALATQGKEDPVFNPIPLAIQQLSVLLDWLRPAPYKSAT